MERDGEIGVQLYITFAQVVDVSLIWPFRWSVFDFLFTS